MPKLPRASVSSFNDETIEYKPVPRAKPIPQRSRSPCTEVFIQHLNSFYPEALNEQEMYELLKERFGQFSWGPRKETPVETVRPNIYLAYICTILSWRDPKWTLAAFLSLNLAYLVTVLFEVKVLGVIAMIIGTMLMLDACIDIKQQPLYFQEYIQAEQILEDLITALVSFRRDAPASFCVLGSMACFILMYIGENIPGVVLFYICLLLVFFVPLGWQRIPDSYAARFKEVALGIFRDEGVLPELELMPSITEVERDADMDSIVTSRTADSASSLGDLLYIPDHDAIDNEDEHDLMPVNPIQDSTDSDSEHRGLSFDCSSDTSDDDFGLKNPQGSNLRRRVTDIEVPTHSRKSSSSDDFEIINAEDLEL